MLAAAPICVKCLNQLSQAQGFLADKQHATQLPRSKRRGALLDVTFVRETLKHTILFQILFLFLFLGLGFWLGPRLRHSLMLRLLLPVFCGFCVPIVFRVFRFLSEVVLLAMNAVVMQAQRSFGQSLQFSVTFARTQKRRHYSGKALARGVPNSTLQRHGRVLSTEHSSGPNGCECSM